MSRYLYSIVQVFWGWCMYMGVQSTTSSFCSSSIGFVDDEQKLEEKTEPLLCVQAWPGKCLEAVWSHNGNKLKKIPAAVLQHTNHTQSTGPICQVPLPDRLFHTLCMPSHSEAAGWSPFEEPTGNNRNKLGYTINIAHAWPSNYVSLTNGISRC